jgi:hypothetical protein
MKALKRGSGPTLLELDERSKALCQPRSEPQSFSLQAKMSEQFPFWPESFASMPYSLGSRIFGPEPKRRTQEIEFPLKKGKFLDGINSSLTRKHAGNIYGKRLS